MTTTAICSGGATTASTPRKGGIRGRSGAGKAVLAAAALVAASLGVLNPAPPAGAVANSWSPTGSLAVARERATATLLLDGTVLVAGGAGKDGDGVYRTRSSAEIYNPATAKWSPTAGPMVAARQAHTATLLPDGTVLLVGGKNDDASGASLASAELYNPATGTFTPVGSMANGRQGHTATLLANGEVLASAGASDAQGKVLLGSWPAEVYNRAQRAWRVTGSNTSWPPIQRIDNRATRLLTGEVLFTGDQPVQRPAAELFEPRDESFRFTDAMANDRRNHTSTLLTDGTVLIQGGVAAAAGSAAVAAAERYDRTLGSFVTTGSLAHGGRDSATATLLPDGTVLVAGGTGLAGVAGAEATAIAERYNPAASTWSTTGAMASTRWNHTATLLRNGSVLIAGGSGGPTGKNLTSAALYDPGAQPARSVSLVLTKHVVASGVVGGPPFCVGGAAVSIRLNGTLVAATTSAADGKYTINLPDRVGNYQAVIKTPTIVNDIPCNKAASSVVSHVH